MNKFSGYEDIKVNTDNFEKVNCGGHICKIINLKINNFVSRAGKTINTLDLQIDFDEKDEQAGFYGKKYSSDCINNTDAKWKGVARITIPDDNSEDWLKTKFKSFVTSVENSNQNYKWTWEEKTLIGKVFGGVFGLEEFENMEGKIMTCVKYRYSRSVANIKDAQIPKVKLINGEYVDYENYEKFVTDRNAAENQNNFNTEQEDDLPF